MQRSRRFGLGVLLCIASLALGGCASSSGPLYYWGDYQPQLYGHLTGEKGPDEQIDRLEAGIEKARSKGKPLPPGYLAHLGLLYAEKQQTEPMLRYFAAERAQYPESAQYIDFLTRHYQTPAAQPRQ